MSDESQALIIQQIKEVSALVVGCVSSMRDKLEERIVDHKRAQIIVEREIEKRVREMELFKAKIVGALLIIGMAISHLEYLLHSK